MKLIKFLPLIFIPLLCACNNNSKQPISRGLYKGIYTAGEQAISFKECDGNHELWISGDTAGLQKQYAALTLQKPDIPVYVEILGYKIKSGKEGMSREFDSTLVISRVLKITKQIPQDICN